MIISNRRKRKLSLRTIIFVGGVVVLILVVALWREAAARMLFGVLEPVLGLRNSLLASEASKLKGELASLEARLADRDALYEENLDLKKRLGRNANIQITLAAVIVRPPGTPYDTFIIDAGADEGVKVGEYVSAGGTTLIGTVSDVYDSTSRVLLFSAPHATYEGLIADKTPVSLEGQGGGSLKGEVPANSGVQVGDRVVVSSVAGGFISNVSHIEHSEGDSFQTVYLHLPVNIFSLRYIEIWKGQPENIHEE